MKITSSMKKEEIYEEYKKRFEELDKIPKKDELLRLYESKDTEEIQEAKISGQGYEYIKNRITEISQEYSTILREKIDNRHSEMENDDKSHYLIYNVLGISNSEGDEIDLHQNTGRFLYKYAGAFLEEITVLCFKYKDSSSGRHLVNNNVSARPNTFEIDCLLGENAYEIKWRDATTDGDHITKEHTRVRAISNAGYKPIRIMFYYPNRDQARRIQEALKDIYEAPRINGEYYSGDEAWEYVLNETEIDLKEILTSIARGDSNNE